jgi:allophanate hydrolase subunit 2
MSDRQTIGGYTVIGVVVSVDINKLAQMKPGDRVRFEKISLESAHSLLMKEEKELRELKENFQEDKPYISNDIKNFNVEVNGEIFNVSVE